MQIAYLASMYAAHKRFASDCLPEFFATRQEAIEAASEEIARVAAMPPHKRDRTIDWAVRFTIRKIRI